MELVKERVGRFIILIRHASPSNKVYDFSLISSSEVIDIVSSGFERDLVRLCAWRSRVSIWRRLIHDKTDCFASLRLNLALRVPCLHTLDS